MKSQKGKPGTFLVREYRFVPDWYDVRANERERVIDPDVEKHLYRKLRRRFRRTSASVTHLQRVLAGLREDDDRRRAVAHALQTTVVKAQAARTQKRYVLVQKTTEVAIGEWQSESLYGQVQLAGSSQRFRGTWMP